MCLALAAAQPAAAQTAVTAPSAVPRTVPVPVVTGPVAVTADSHPFAGAAFTQAPIDLAARGYVEEEFLVSGTGNVYDWNTDGTLATRASALPYTTRILVRRPSTQARFSGTVLVDVANQGAAFDTFAVWGQLSDHLLANGHAYVALTVFARNIGALLKNAATAGPMGGLRVERVFASMQSGGDLPTYVAAIHRNVALANGTPVIHIVAQPEVSPAIRRPDSDTAGDRFRRYELPGASHLTSGTSSTSRRSPT